MQKHKLHNKLQFSIQLKNTWTKVGKNLAPRRRQEEEVEEDTIEYTFVGIKPKGCMFIIHTTPLGYFLQVTAVSAVSN